MREPAYCGLFTVCEADERDTAPLSLAELPGKRFPFTIPSAAASSEVFPSPSVTSREMDLPRDVEMDDGEEMRRRLSWSSETDESVGAATPDIEEEDPFSLDYAWEGMPVDDDTYDSAMSAEVYETVMIDEDVIATSSRHRRPPPLELVKYHHPFSAASLSDEPDPLITPRTSSIRITPASLLPALPILSPTRWHSQSPSTPTFKRRSHRRNSPDDPVDLVSALEDLLSSCGEPLSSDSEDEIETSTLSFPLPPSRTPLSADFDLRTPRTPEKNSRVTFPSPPSTPGPTERLRPKLKGDHSFLQSMSRRDSPSSSVGSSSSGRSLPGRGKLPSDWMGFGGDL